MYELQPERQPKKNDWTRRISIAFLSLLAVFIVYVLVVSSRPTTNIYRIAPSNANSFETSGHSVTYKVTGSDGLSITYANDGGDTAQTKTYKQTWDYSFRAKSGQFLYVSAQNQGKYGGVQCEIVVDGSTVKHTESQGGYVIASCSTSAR